MGGHPPLDALPPSVRERACLVVADSVGVSAHGMQVPEMRGLSRAIWRMGDPDAPR